jgi:hypothetical protein
MDGELRRRIGGDGGNAHLEEALDLEGLSLDSFSLSDCSDSCSALSTLGMVIVAQGKEGERAACMT